MAELRLITNREYDAHPRHRLDCFLPDPLRSDAPLVICLHGGWWHGGHREDLHATAMILAEAGLPAAVAGFRRLQDIPGHDGEEMVGDCVAAARHALEEALLHGHDGRHLALLGVGSGAVLALLTAARMRLQTAFNLHSVVAVSGCYDLSALDTCANEVRHQAAAFLGADPTARNPTAVRAGLIPPVHLVHGESDTMVPAALAVAFGDHLRLIERPVSCCVVPGGTHETLERPYRGPGEAVLRGIVAWLAADQHAESDGPPIGEPSFLRS
jgi:arylformamidase